MKPVIAHALSTEPAAAWLAKSLPQKTSAQWSHWLKNNRRQDRTVPMRLPHERICGIVLYAVSDLQRWVRVQRMKSGSVPATPADIAWMKSISSTSAAYA